MSQDAGTPESEVRAVLELVRGNAVQLLAALRHPPSALRIHAGGVVVEAEWPVNGTATGVVDGDAHGAIAAGDDARAGETDTERLTVRAPAVGVFYRSPEPGAKPFVDVGDSVHVGQQVAIVEIMKLMVPVHAEAGGTIVEVLKENGEHVEYDEALFALEPEE
jgi:acetyl-CoA carboxylase biotin carboxyl carrier protein